MADSINGFFGDYRFLSNFHLAAVEYDGQVYPSTEHAYQAAKTLDEHERFLVLFNVKINPDTNEPEIVSVKTPKEAKRQGKSVTLRPDWEAVKYSVMANVVSQKFNNHPDLREALLETGNAYLEETNTWKDTYWGVCDNVGKNNLGKILMDIRAQLTQLEM